VVVNNTVGIDLPGDDGFGIQIYPNPASGKVILTISSAVEEYVDVVVTHASGAIVLTMKDIAVNKQLKKELGLEDLPAGIYYLSVTGKDSHAVKKLILK